MGEDTSSILHQGDTAAARLRMRTVANDSAVKDTQRAQANFARFFMFGDCLDNETLTSAFGDNLVTLLRETALINNGRSRIDLRPIDIDDKTIYIASDLGVDVNARPIDADYILGVGGASLSLLHLIPTSPVKVALDIGTGCGIQALYMSSFAKRVVVTDISSRALWFAKFNALLNQIDNLDFRQGSFFEPVTGEQFDLIVTNPPFVITPPSVRKKLDYTYRDAGMDADAAMYTVVAQAQNYLRPHGRFVALGNWQVTNTPPTNTSEHIRSWLSPTCNWWVGLRDWQTPEEYIHLWLKDSGQNLLSPSEYEHLFSLWLQGFERANINGISMGYILGIKNGAPTASSKKISEGEVMIVDQQTGKLPAGSVLFERLHHSVMWKKKDTRSRLDTHYHVHPKVKERRLYQPGSEQPCGLEYVNPEGVAIGVDTVIAACVGACDGELSLDAIIGAVASLLDADVDGLREQVLSRWGTLLHHAIVTH